MCKGDIIFPGGVTEWPKVHDWKSCVSQGTKGSNPFLSAIFLILQALRYGKRYSNCCDNDLNPRE